MRRFGRMFRKMLTPLSAALLAVTIVLWARSMVVTNRLAYHVTGKSSYATYSATVGDGLFTIECDFGHRFKSQDDFDRWIRFVRSRRTTDGWSLGSCPSAGFPGHGWFGGFACYRDVGHIFWGNFHQMTTYHLRVPAYFVAVLLSILPLRRAWTWYRRGPAQGCCARCGYDLRATPERCPECGQIA